MQQIFESTKRFGPISTGHRQWRDDGHCRFIHGYGRIVEIVFGCHELDDRMWVMDFGNLRGVKQFLESHWDHKVLIASDDPLMQQIEEAENCGLLSVTIMDVDQGYGPGIEGSCKWVYDKVGDYIEDITKGRVWIQQVRIWEHENNSAIYRRP